MLYHIVLFKFDKSASTQKYEQLYTAFKTFVDIPGVLKVDFGPAEDSPYRGYSLRNRDYTHALLVIVKDRKALETYEHSSIHNLVRNDFIKPLLDKSQSDVVLAFDFEGHFDKKKGFFARLIPEWNLQTILITSSIVTGISLVAGFWLRRKLLK